MTNNFQISYTLDVLFYIECMLNEEKRQLYDEEVARFMPMLGTVSDKQLVKLQNIYLNAPNSISKIVAMLITSPELHTWKITDLVNNHKNLVTTFKQSKEYRNASSSLKKFAVNDFMKMMPMIKTIAIDLERLEFKKFWLEESLPVLKEQINEYEHVLGQLDIAAVINGWVVDKKIPTGNEWYLLAYSGNEYQPVLRSYGVISPKIPADELFVNMIEYAVRVNDYRKFCKRLKPTVALKMEYKDHPLKKSFKGISGYAEVCFKMALKKYLAETVEKVYPELPVDYPLADVMLEYLRTNEKLKIQPTSDYVSKMFKSMSK